VQEAASASGPLIRGPRQAKVSSLLPGGESGVDRKLALICDSIRTVPPWRDRMDANSKTHPDHTMKIIDEMLNLALLTADQHQQISAWMTHADSPEEILKMPAPLWRAVERASEVMGIDDDLMRPPSLDADDMACN
jgi:hypothetical protein